MIEIQNFTRYGTDSLQRLIAALKEGQKNFGLNDVHSVDSTPVVTVEYHKSNPTRHVDTGQITNFVELPHKIAHRKTRLMLMKPETLLSSVELIASVGASEGIPIPRKFTLAVAYSLGNMVLPWSWAFQTLITWDCEGKANVIHPQATAGGIPLTKQQQEWQEIQQADFREKTEKARILQASIPDVLLVPQQKKLGKKEQIELRKANLKAELDRDMGEVRGRYSNAFCHVQEMAQSAAKADWRLAKLNGVKSTNEIKTQEEERLIADIRKLFNNMRGDPDE